MSQALKRAGVRRLGWWHVANTKLDYQGDMAEIIGMTYINDNTGQVYLSRTTCLFLSFDEAIAQLRDRIEAVAEREEAKLGQ